MKNRRFLPIREPSAKGALGGGGGRWTIWPMRVVLWATILVIGYRGITAILLNETPSSGNANPGNDGAAGDSQRFRHFRSRLARLSPCGSGNCGLTYSPSTATQRAQQLAAFIPANAGRRTRNSAGWAPGPLYRAVPYR